MTRAKEIMKEAKKFAKEIDDWEIAEDVQDAFEQGAEWADSHPHWISVEDELPKIGWTMSDTVVVTDGNGGLRLAWYHQDEGWHFATGLPFEPTHWMPLPQPPESGNNSKEGGEA